MRAVINYSLYTESHNRQTRPLVCVIVVFFRLWPGWKHRLDPGLWTLAPLVKVGHRSGSRRVESVKKQTTNMKGTPPPHHNQHSSYHMPPLPVISTQMRNEKKTYRTKQKKRLGLKTLIYFTLHFSKTKLHIIMYFLCLILKIITHSHLPLKWSFLNKIE